MLNVKMVWYLVLFISSSLLAEDALPFSFVKTPLIPLLTKTMPENTRLILPQNAHDLHELQQQQATYLSPKRMTTKKSAWSILKTLLEMSGYSVAQKDTQFTVVRNKSVSGGAINREVLPTYAGVLPAMLVPDDTRIRYIHYLKNLKVPTLVEKDSHPFTKMIQEMLSSDASLLFYPRTNALIISDKASHVIAIARLLNDFDSRGLNEEVAYVPLKYLSSKSLEAILTSLKIASQDSQGRKFIRSDADADSLLLYAEDTHIVADPIRNGVILLGRKNNVERIADFIQNSLDVPQASGETILHFYDLQYLDAQKFASVLTRIVSSTLPQETQATQEGHKPFFQGVSIAVLETPQQGRESHTESIVGSEKDVIEVPNLEMISVNAGNRLIIAARQKDWKIIHELIKKLDKPEPQVLLEVLIAEFTYDSRLGVSSTLRSQSCNALLPENVQYLASHITPVNSVLGTTPVQLAQDLLAVVGPNNGVPTVASQASPGSLLISLNDPKTPGIFGLIEILQTTLATKITSSPHITVTNNQEGIVDSSQVRRSTGELVTTTDGSFTIPIENVTASVTVKATPHIVSEKKLRLTIELKIEDFRGSRLDRISRELKTTSTLNSGEILAMGGLIRTDKNEQVSGTPLLSHIPILGLLFRGTAMQKIRTNITLFVLPTIIEPRKQSILQRKAQELICMYDEAANTLQRPSDAHDPIVRIFFKEATHSGNRLIKSFANDYFDVETGCQPKLLYSEAPKKTPLKLFDPYELRRILQQKTRPIVPHRKT